jgi:hypothetical protein
MDRINWSAVKNNSCAYYHNNRYFLFVPLDNDTTALTCLVYNTITQKWMGDWGKSWDAHVIYRADTLDPFRLRWGRYDGKVYEWYDYITEETESLVHFQDNGSNIKSSLTTRAYDFQEPDSPKDLATAKFEFWNSRAYVDIGLILDRGSKRYIEKGFDTHDMPVNLPVTLPFNFLQTGVIPRKIDLYDQPPCMEVQAELTSNSDKMVVRKIVIAAHVGSMGAETAT